MGQAETKLRRSTTVAGGTGPGGRSQPPWGIFDVAALDVKEGPGLHTRARTLLARNKRGDWPRGVEGSSTRRNWHSAGAVVAERSGGVPGPGKLHASKDLRQGCQETVKGKRTSPERLEKGKTPSLTQGGKEIGGLTRTRSKQKGKSGENQITRGRVGEGPSPYQKQEEKSRKGRTSLTPIKNLVREGLPREGFLLWRPRWGEKKTKDPEYRVETTVRTLRGRGSESNRDCVVSDLKIDEREGQLRIENEKERTLPRRPSPSFKYAERRTGRSAGRGRLLS